MKVVLLASVLQVFNHLQVGLFIIIIRDQVYHSSDIIKLDHGGQIVIFDLYYTYNIVISAQ